MDTLVAGYRKQKDGPVSEALIATEDASGKVGIQVAVFDENYPATQQTANDTLLSHSFITIPAGMMDRLVSEWQERHPQGVTEPHYGELETAGVGADSSEPAAKFIGERLAR